MMQTMREMMADPKVKDMQEFIVEFADLLSGGEMLPRKILRLKKKWHR